MRTKLFFALLFISFSFVVLNGCKKNDDDSDNGTSVNAAKGVSGTINGVAWKAQQTNITAYIWNNIIQFNASDSTGKTITFLINGSTTGTYPISVVGGNRATYKESSSSPLFVSDIVPNAGTFVLTNLDPVNKTISGTFAFTILSAVISNGTFNTINYATTIPPENILLCKGNGTNYNAYNFNITHNFGFIDIKTSGGDVNAASLNLMIDVSQGPGTYGIATGNNFGYYITSMTGSNLMDLSGQLIIMDHNTITQHMTGKFNFIENDQSSGTNYAITDGIFSIDY